MGHPTSTKRFALGFAFFLCTLAIPAGGLASPGPGDAPEHDIDDAAGDAGQAASWGDLVAGWFDSTGRNVTVTLQMQQLDMSRAELGASWYVTAQIGNQTIGWGALVDVGGAIFYWWSPWTADGPAAFRPSDGNLTPGSMGTVTINLPRYEANVTGQNILQIHAHSAQFTALQGPSLPSFVPFDDADGRAVTLRAPFVNPYLPRNATANNTTGGSEGAVRTPGVEGVPLLASLVLVAVAQAGRRPKP